MLSVRRRATVLIAAALVAIALMLPGAAPGLAADTGPGNGGSSSNGSLTVSWLPEDQPTQIVRGATSTSRFWVTNTSPAAIPVHIRPAVAIPGDDGHLDIEGGSDSRFDWVRFAPDQFTLPPGQTIEVVSTVQAPADLPPGAYLIPAMVQPDATGGSGNLQIDRAIVALTTFQLPGTIVAKISASVTPTTAAGELAGLLPLLPIIVVGDRGQAVLRIRSDSSAGLYVYYEALGSIRGIGTMAFDGATAGAPDDLRGTPSLYFPGTGRDFELNWRNSPFGVGLQTIDATASFNPDPQNVRTVASRASFLVVSPWWLVVFVAALAGVLIVSIAGARRAARAALARRSAKGGRARRRAAAMRLPGRAGILVGTVVIGLLSVMIALYSEMLVIGAALLIGAAIVTAAALLARRRPRAARRLVLAFHLATWLVVVAVVVLVVMAATTGWSPAVAVAGSSAAGLWTIAAWWLGRELAARAEMD